MGKEEDTPKVDRYIRGIKNGSSEIYEEIYRTFFGMVKGYLSKMGATTEDASTVMYDSLTAIYINTCKPDFKIRSSFKNYLMAVVKNVWISRFKGKLSFEDDDTLGIIIDKYGHVPSFFDDFIQKNESDEKVKKLKIAINKLKNDCREIIIWFYYHGLSHVEIAEVTQYTADYTRLKLHRCKEKLKILY